MIKFQDGTVAYEGLVLGTREQNMYHDSYFYAQVWDEATKTIKEIEYAATAYPGGHYVSVDATPETRKHIFETLLPSSREWATEYLTKRESELRKGISVNVVKGKKNVGCFGQVFWFEHTRDYYGRIKYTKVGIALNDRKDDRGRFADVVFDYWTNCKVQVTLDSEVVEKYARSHAAELAGYEQELAIYS